MTRSIAIPENPDEIIKFLVKKRANIHVVDSQGRNSLMRATGSVDFLAIAKVLLALGQKVNEKDNEGKTILFHIVSTYGEYYERAQRIEESDYRNMTPVLELLKKHKLNFNLQDNKGFTAFNYASQKGYAKIGGLIKRYSL